VHGDQHFHCYAAMRDNIYSTVVRDLWQRNTALLLYNFSDMT